MRKIKIGIYVFLAALLSPAVHGAPADGAKNGEAGTASKTCECVRRHTGGFPYIEKRTVPCKKAKTETGAAGSHDCPNCYTLCSDKPAT